MPTTGPDFGLLHTWAARESGWNTGMDANLKKLDATMMLSVINRTTATPPGSPTNGDRYIVAASPTGVWVGHTNDIALWNGAAWVFYTPSKGWLAYSVADDKHYRFGASSTWVLMV